MLHISHPTAPHDLYSRTQNDSHPHLEHGLSSRKGKRGHGGSGTSSPSFLPCLISQQVKWLILTSVRQGSITFPQGRTATIVNNSVIYHIMIFHVYPGDSEEERNSCPYCGGFSQSSLQLEKDRWPFKLPYRPRPLIFMTVGPSPVALMHRIIICLSFFSTSPVSG